MLKKTSGNLKVLRRLLLKGYDMRSMEECMKGLKENFLEMGQVHMHVRDYLLSVYDDEKNKDAYEHITRSLPPIRHRLALNLIDTYYSIFGPEPWDKLPLVK